MGHCDKLDAMEPSANDSAKSCCNFSTRFDARLDAVPKAQAFIAQGLRRNGVAHDLVARSEMIVEELFRNTVLHGYRGDSTRPVWIGVCGDAHGAGFWYEDEAPPFDPLSADCAHLRRDLAGPVDRLDAGGVGLLLIRQLATRIAYIHEAGRNRITVSWQPARDDDDDAACARRGTP